MIKELIFSSETDNDTGVHSIFGLSKHRYDILYSRAIDVFNDYVLTHKKIIKKDQIVKRLVHLGETPNEEACMLYWAGEFIAELQIKNANPLMSIFSLIK